MKKWTYGVLMILTIQSATGQETTSFGKYIIGGYLDFYRQSNAFPYNFGSLRSSTGRIYSNNNNDAEYTSFAVRPYLGKEISPHLTLGLQLYYGTGKNKSAVFRISSGQLEQIDIQSNYNEIGVGVFSRHVLNPDNLFNLYIEPYLEYNLQNSEERENSIVSTEIKANYFDLGIRLGALYNISDRLRATMRVGRINYANGKWEVLNTETVKKFNSLELSFYALLVSIGFELKL